MKRVAYFVVRQIWQVYGDFGMAFEEQMKFFSYNPATRRDQARLTATSRDCVTATNRYDQDRIFASIRGMGINWVRFLCHIGSKICISH